MNDCHAQWPMNSRNLRPGNQLDRLIRQALVDSVAGEEPPARVWERIRSALTQPAHQPAIRWSGAMFQAALLLFVLVLSGALVWQGPLLSERSVVSYSVPAPAGALTSDDTNYPPSPSRAARVWTLMVYSDASREMSPRTISITPDTEELALLRKRTPARPRTSATGEPKRRTPATSDATTSVPPDITSLRAKAIFLRSLQEREPPGRERGPALEPVPASGPLWQ